MPRSFNIFVNAVGLGLVLLAGTSRLAALHAEPPPNPLRPAPSVAAINRTEPTPADPRSQPLAWQMNVDDQAAAEPPSVVPRQFGQPELLPPPVGTSGIPADKFAGADLSDPAPWHNLVHPW